MNSKKLKTIGFIIAAIMVLNLALAAFRITNWTIFWVVILLGAVFVYLVLPKLKN